MIRHGRLVLKPGKPRSFDLRLAASLGAALAALPAGAAESPAVTNAPAARLPAMSALGGEAPAATTTRLQEMVVTGTREETEVSKVPADVSVITEEELRKPGVNGYQEALRPVAGVKINSRQEGDISIPGIEVRGLDSNPTSGANTLVLLDGIPQRRLSFAGPYVGALPFDALNRMELIKGPMSSLYGRNAMSGALQLFTDPGSEAWTVQTWNTYESPLDYVKAAWRVAGPLSTNGATFSLTGSGSYTGGWQPRTDGYQGSAYLHVRAPFGEQNTLTLVGGYYDGYRNLAAPVLIDQNGQRIPGIAREQNLAVPAQNSLDLQEARLGAIWDRNWTEQAKSKATFAYWNGQSYWKVGRPDDRPAAGTVLNRASSNRPYDEQNFFGELQHAQSYNLFSDFTGTLIGGADLEYATYRNGMQSIWSPGSSAANGIQLDLATMTEPDPRTWIYGATTTRDTSEWDPGIFLRNHLTLWERVELEGGVRYDRYQRHQLNLNTGASSTVHGDAFSPSVGLSYQFLKNDAHTASAYAGWGQGFSPVFRSVGTTEIVDVRPETSQSYEAGLKSSLFHDRIEGTLAVYRQERNDVVGAISPTLTSNIGDWVVEGIEAGLKLRPMEGVTLFGNYTHRDPRVTRDLTDALNVDKLIPFVSQDMFTAGIAYQAKCGFFTGLENYFVGSSYADNHNTIHLPAYHLLNTYVGYRWKGIEASFFVRNLLDEEYFSAVFTSAVVKNGSAFEGLPRTFGVSVNARF